MENGLHNVSFTCYFAPSRGIIGKCFIDFLDGSRSFTIEADNSVANFASYSTIIFDAMEYRINVHDVFSNGTVQKDAIVIATTFSIPSPSPTLHTQSPGIWSILLRHSQH